MLDLKPYLDKNPTVKAALSQPVLDSVTVGEGIYGIPTTFNAEVIFYNKKHFRDNKLSVPKTYDAFLNCVDTLKKAGLAPIALGNKESWNGSILYTMLAERLGGFPLYEDTVLKLAKPFNNPAYVKAGQLLQDLVNRGAFNSNFQSQETTYAQALLATGKAGMFVNGDWELAGLYKELKADLGWFTMPPIPGGVDNEPVQMIGGANNALCVGTSSSQHDEAVDFIMFLMSAERQKAEAAANQLIAADYKLGPKDGNDLTRSIHAALSSATHVMIPWDNPLGVYLGEKIDDGTQLMYAGNDVAKSLADFDKLVKTHGR